jgi:hypothetical protein
MKKALIIILVLLAVAQIGSASAVAAPSVPGFPDGVKVTFLTLLPTELDVGETYTIRVQVESDKPFAQAIIGKDAYYPGRGVFLTTGRRAHDDTSAVLTAEITGKSSTADLASVCDWPLPDSTCTPDGTAPLAIVVAVRYRGGEVYGQYYPFAVEVKP